MSPGRVFFGATRTLVVLSLCGISAPFSFSVNPAHSTEQEFEFLPALPEQRGLNACNRALSFHEPTQEITLLDDYDQFPHEPRFPLAAVFSESTISTPETGTQTTVELLVGIGEVNPKPMHLIQRTSSLYLPAPDQTHAAKTDLQPVSSAKVTAPNGWTSGRRVVLSNFGKGRYFWFVPEGLNHLVPARVLNIHTYKLDRTSVKTIMIEVLLSDDLPGSRRVRFIAALSPQELKTIEVHDEARGATRQTAYFAFFLSLTPMEVNTRNLAKTLGVAAYGASGTSGMYSPRRIMATSHNIGVSGFFREKFGRPDDLMSSEERDQKYPNMIDVAARMDPREYMKQFRLQPDEYYFWVITEDGRLKITTFGPKTVNVHPLTLRLAHGRRIYAAGLLRFVDLESNSVDLTLQSADYTGYEGTHVFEGFGNPNVVPFVAAVFKTQTDLILPSDFENAIPKITSISSDGSAFGFEFEEEPKSLGRETTQPHKKLKWGKDPEYPYPLPYEEWLEKLEIPDASADTNQRYLKQEWAHYVLQTEPDQSLGEIKRSYRKLSLSFHEDRHLGSERFEQAASAFRTIGQAWAHLEQLGKAE